MAIWEHRAGTPDLQGRGGGGQGRLLKGWDLEGR